MADNIDRKVFEEMIQVIDPFDPLFAPSTGKTAKAVNKELEDKWMEENVVMGMPPDLSFTPLMTLRGGKALFSKKSFEAYQNALNRLRKVVKWGDVEGTVRVRDIVSKGQGPHYKSDPEQYFTDKEWSKLELGEYRDMFAKFIREERKAAGIVKPPTPPTRRYVKETDTYYVDWEKQTKYDLAMAKLHKKNVKSGVSGDPFDYLDKNIARYDKEKLKLLDELKKSEIKQAGYKHNIFPEYESEFSRGKLLDYIEELRKLQN